MENIFSRSGLHRKGARLIQVMVYYTYRTRIGSSAPLLPCHTIYPTLSHHTHSRSMLLPLDGLDVTACGEGEGDERDMDVV